MVRAAAMWSLFPLDIDDAAYVVGDGPAVYLDYPSPAMEVQARMDVDLHATVRNAGNQAAEVALTSFTTDLVTNEMVFENTFTMHLPAGSAKQALIPFLPNSEPGTYLSSLFVGGMLYDNVQYQVLPLDDLEGSFGDFNHQASLGESVRLPISVVDRFGLPADPTLIQVTAISPFGERLELAVNRVDTGRYEAEFSTFMPGTYRLEVEVELGGLDCVGDSSYIVFGSPSELSMPMVFSFLIDGYGVLQVMVMNEHGALVTGARVRATNVQGTPEATTQENGIAMLFLFPHYPAILELDVQADGYVGGAWQVKLRDSTVFLPFVRN